MELSSTIFGLSLIALLVLVFIFIHKDHKAWIKSEAEAEALKKHKKAIKQKEEEEAKKVAKRIAEQKLAHSKKYDEILYFRTYELAKLTKTILDGVDLKNLKDVLPILESQAFQGKAVNEFLDDLSVQFRDAIVERVNASASEQEIQMEYSDKRISTKVDDLVATCIEMGRPILLTKLEIKDAGNFDGVNKSKIGKTKKWEGA
jgi:DNA-binding ferritin-like protein (Dps family)